MSGSSREASVVIGAASGIGQAIAVRLAGQYRGRLVLADTQFAKVSDVAASLRILGADVVAVQVDIADPASIDALVQSAGPVSRVALAAGIMNRHPALEMTTSVFESVFRVNLIGTYLSAQGFAASMLKSGIPGSIVAVTSAAAIRPHADLAAYAASKAGLTMALRVLALGVASNGIRINMVAPTATDTAMMTSDPDELGRQIPLGRVNHAADIAAAAAFLLSTDSVMITMRELPVDGGSLHGR